MEIERTPKVKYNYKAASSNCNTDNASNKSANNSDNSNYKNLPDSKYIKSMYFQNNLKEENDAFNNELTSEEKNKVYSGKLDKSVVIKLINLIKQGYIGAYIFKNISYESEFQQNILDDIKLIQNAKENNIPLEDAYIPEYSSIKEFYKKRKSDTELCSINGQVHYNIGYTLLPLKMDKETYMKLFPPLSRFAINQQKNGDCYLISALTNIYNNPNTRLKVLQCFEQDGNDLKVKLPNSDTTYTIKDGQLDDKQYGDKEQYALGAEWIRILEYVYGQECRNEYVQNAKDKTFELLDKAFEKKADIENKIAATEAQIESVEMLKRDLDEYNKIQHKDEFINRKIESLQKRISELNEPELAMNLELYQFCKESSDLIFDENINSKEDLDKALEELEDIWMSKEESPKIKIDIFRNIQGIVKNVSSGITGIDLIKDDDKIEQLKKQYKTNYNYYRESGNICEVYLKFGLNSRLFDTNQFSNQAARTQLIKQLKSAHAHNYLIAAGTKDNIPINKEKNIIPKHAYNIELSYNTEGEISYNIINPHNNAVKTPISEEELQENFKWLAIINN